MRKMLLAIFAVLLMIGSVLVFTTNVSACHSMSASCSPTEKDITDINTWMITYEIHVQLNPGCGDYYWVGFEVSNAPSKFHRKLYEKGDASKTNIATVGSSPPDANHNNWNAGSIGDYWSGYVETNTSTWSIYRQSDNISFNLWKITRS